MSATPPAAQHRRSIGRSELFDLKQLFGVSVQALVMRGRDIGIFSAPLVRELFGEFKRRGWRDPPYEEPHTLEGELPGRFQRICFRVVAEGAISDARPPSCRSARSATCAGKWTTVPTAPPARRRKPAGRDSLPT